MSQEKNPPEKPEKPATKKPRNKRAKRKSSDKRTAGDTTVVSMRLRNETLTSLEILRAKHPYKSQIDRVSDAIDQAADRTETLPPAEFRTLDGKGYTLLKAENLKLRATLEGFREQLLEAELDDDDSRRTEKIAEILEDTEGKLTMTNDLLQRIARLALLPAIPTGPEYHLLLELIAHLMTLEADAKPDKKPMWHLMLKIARTYLA
jgi:hypothetical protein